MTNNPLEKRIDNLEQEIHTLNNRLNDLTSRLNIFEKNPPQAAPAELSLKASPADENLSPLPDIDSDRLWSMVGKSSLLPRIATICFIMVFALILRTLTDNNIIGVQLGSYVGMGYATLLIGWGVKLLAQKSRLATVFPVCGVLLMYSIALESHIRFASVSSSSVYFILLVLLIVTSMVSIRFHHVSLNALGIFGTCIVASFIDFPKPYFTPLIYLLLAGNIFAFFSAKKLDKGEWNRFTVFILTVIVWLLWTFRLRVPLQNCSNSGAYLAENWFFPTIILFSIIFMAMSAYVALTKKSTVLDLILPALNVIWAYSMAQVIINAGKSSTSALGFTGLFFGVVHFLFAVYLFKKRPAEMRAICGFTVAGLLLFILASPLAIGSSLPALLLWSIMAFILAKISKNITAGGLRLLSYLLFGITGIAGIAYGDFLTSSPRPIAAMIIAGIIAGLSGIQFKWCRKEAIITKKGFFGRVDRADRSALILLVTSLVCAYCMLQLLSFLAINTFSANPANALTGVQSILINAGAISLLLLAMPGRNKEILTTAVFIIIIGAFKVFGYDLFKSNGIPLVLSVLSFGGVAAVGSVVLSRWSRNS